MSRMTEADFWDRMTLRGECLEWTGCKDRKGYGRVHFEGSGWVTHRLAWFITNGLIPDGMLVCHHCDNPSCCNPEHLFLGTNTDNMRDCSVKGRTHRGDRHTNAKLTFEKVKDIRLNAKTMLLKDLAHKHGVHISTVCDVIKGRSWLYRQSHSEVD